MPCLYSGGIWYFAANWQDVVNAYTDGFETVSDALDKEKSGTRSLLNPFDLGRGIDGRNLLNIIDDFGRAAFGINGGSSIIENYGVVWATDRWQHCGN